MTTHSDGAPDEGFWRRPAGAPIEPPAEAVSTGPEVVSYSGPPSITVPPPGWRPQVVIQPPPPRRLPGQDFAGIEAEEQTARRVTYGVGLAAGAVLLVVVCLLCSRVVF